MDSDLQVLTKSNSEGLAWTRHPYISNLEGDRDAGRVARQKQHTRVSLYPVHNVCLSNLPLVVAITPIFPSCLIYQCRCNGLVPEAFTLKNPQISRHLPLLWTHYCPNCASFALLFLQINPAQSSPTPRPWSYVVTRSTSMIRGKKITAEILNIAGTGGI